MNRVILSPEYFPNPSIGRPVSNADIYVGIVDLDPEIVGNQKQVSVQQENGSIVQVSQPVKTGAGGVPLNNGSPVTILVDGNYSLKVLDKLGAQIYYVPSIVDFDTGIQTVDDMLGLINLVGNEDGDIAIMSGYFVSFPQLEFSGGGRFAWQENADKAQANGGTIIDPANTGGFDGTTSTRDAFLTAQGGGVGLGCWVRTDEDYSFVSGFGVVADDVVIENVALQAAFDAIDNPILNNGTHKVSLNNVHTPVSGLPYNYAINLTDGINIKGQTNSIVKTTDLSGVVFHIPRGVNDVSIDGATFTGGGSNLNDVNSLAFGIATAIDSNVTTKEYSNIDINHCSFTGGFNIDIDLRGATDINLQYNEHNGTLFSRFSAGTAVGGYQCHIASCSRVEHSFNTHKSGGFDRHGFYNATAQAGVNSDIFSHHNIYEWDNTDYAFNPFMAAINLRPGNNVNINHEIVINPHGGGITSITDSGNSFNRLSISDNIITGVTGADGSAVAIDQAAGISLRASAGSYAFVNIDNNLITSRVSTDVSKVVGISTSGSRINVTNNNITMVEANQFGIQMILASTETQIHGNQLHGSSLAVNPILIDAVAALVGCKVGINRFEGFTGDYIGSNDAFTSDGSILSDPYAVTLTSDGIGGITFVDPYALISSVVSVAAGIRIIFKATLMRPDLKKTFSTSKASSVYSLFTPAGSTINLDIGVRDLAGASLPAATNAYSINVGFDE